MFARFIQYFLMLFMLFCISNAVHAVTLNHDKKILIIIPTKKEPYKGMVESIEQELVDKKWTGEFKVLNLGVGSYEGILKGNHLVIPIGAKSLDYYLSKKIRTPYLPSFITQSAFSALSNKFNNPNGSIPQFIGGVSIEQPLNRLVSLATLIKPDIKSVGVVLGPNTISKRDEVQRKIKKSGGVLHVADIKAHENPLKKLRQTFQYSQAVIVVPDKADFNRKLARWVVTLSYKYKVPVISYSRKYAEAGALISLYSQEKEIGKQTAEIALAYISQSRFSPRLVAPKYFQIHINQSVNKALGLMLPPSEVLLKKLYKTEP